MSLKPIAVATVCQETGERKVFASHRQASAYLNCHPGAVTWGLTGIVAGHRLERPTPEELEALENRGKAA